MRFVRLSAILFCTGLLFGCGTKGDDSMQSELALMKTTNPSPSVLDQKTEKNVDMAEGIKEEIENYKEIYDAAIVKGDKDILVAYKVKHMYRFQMKKIEKDLKKRLEKKYPDEKFAISSDYKIFLEAIRLQEKMRNPDFSRKEANKRLQKIIKLQQEMT